MTDAAGPLAAYRSRLAEGRLKPDPMQALAAEKLERLWRAVRSYNPHEGISGWRARFGLARRSDPAPLGLYLFGAAGRGKSMLMDLFFAAANVERKRRVHFYAFMLEVHERMHRLRQAPVSAANATADLIARVADELAEHTWLLCFDEFQVTNIADAVILGRLFAGLFERGMVVVATSNTAPDDLYADGLQRELFLPAIRLLNERLDVLELEGGIDYRRVALAHMAVYHTPLGRSARDALEASFAALADGVAGTPEDLIVQGRRLVMARAANGVAMTNFAELCERPLGPADYLAIATHFHTLILDGIPRLDREMRNQARRFITLIDTLYEHRAKLVCAAAVPPDDLHPTGDHAAEFRRTASRLHEMQSEAYLARPHLT